MPKAKHVNTTTDLSPAIARMRQLAAEAGDHLLLGDGPPHPDWELLDLCADALHFMKQVANLSAQRETLDDGRAWTDATRATWKGINTEKDAWVAKAVQCLRRAKKLRATTAAGIYAKAMLVRGSRTGAVDLARSLADDLLDCRVLRESVWPAAQSAAEAVA